MCGLYARTVRSKQQMVQPIVLLSEVHISVLVLILSGVFVDSLGPAGTVSTMATSGGQTFQITGASVGGKVLTAKLPLPANSKIVTVNVPTTQGGKDDIIITIIVIFYFI